MTALTHGTNRLADAPRVEPANRRGMRLRQASQGPLPAGFFFGFMRRAGAERSRWVRLLLEYWLRRSLRTLTDEQLRDAGIDPAKAGRGRAAAARFDPNIGTGY